MSRHALFKGTVPSRRRRDRPFTSKGCADQGTPGGCRLVTIKRFSDDFRRYEHPSHVRVGLRPSPLAHLRHCSFGIARGALKRDTSCSWVVGLAVGGG